MSTAETEIETLYRKAKAADDAFEAACRAAGFTSRWADGVLGIPTVKAARDAKVAADEALHLAFLAARGVVGTSTEADT